MSAADLVALGLLIGVVAAFKLLPWWASVGVVVGALMLGRFLVGKLFKNVIVGLLGAKSAVLKGASVRLHGIWDAPEPKHDEDWEDDEEDLEAGPRCYRYVDLTITPAGSDGPSRRVSDIHAVAVYEDGQWLPLEGAKLMGSQRIRLHVGVISGQDQFKVQYYFEILKNAGSDS